MHCRIELDANFVSNEQFKLSLGRMIEGEKHVKVEGNAAMGKTHLEDEEFQIKMQDRHDTLHWEMRHTHSIKSGCLGCPMEVGPVAHAASVLVHLIKRQNFNNSAPCRVGSYCIVIHVDLSICQISKVLHNLTLKSCFINWLCTMILKS